MAGPGRRCVQSRLVLTRGFGWFTGRSSAVLHGASAQRSTAETATGRAPIGASLRAEHPVGGAADGGGGTVDVRVDHRRGDIAVTEELLNGPDVVAVFEQVGRERVAKSIRTLLMNCPLCGFATVTIHSPAPRFR